MKLAVEAHRAARVLETARYPGWEMIRDWLNAGVFEPGKGFAPTVEGTPQGGVISPLLLNIALHGLEEAAGVRYEPSDPDRVKRGSPSLVRYADDMVVFCHSRQEAEQVKAKLAAWLAPRGLSFNEEETRIVCLDEGFDFLGFTARRYHGKLIIKPSKAAIKRVRNASPRKCAPCAAATRRWSSPRSTRFIRAHIYTPPSIFTHGSLDLIREPPRSLFHRSGGKSDRVIHG